MPEPISHPRFFARRLALHTWTLESTPFAETLRIAREAGWDAVEIRRSDVMQCCKSGLQRDAVIRLIRDSGIAVAVMGTEYGLLFARGDEYRRLLAVLDETCMIAKAVGCDMIMTATGQATGGIDTAAGHAASGGSPRARARHRALARGVCAAGGKGLSGVTELRGAESCAVGTTGRGGGARRRRSDTRVARRFVMTNL